MFTSGENCGRDRYRGAGESMTEKYEDCAFEEWEEKQEEEEDEEKKRVKEELL